MMESITTNTTSFVRVLLIMTASVVLELISAAVPQKKKKKDNTRAGIYCVYYRYESCTYSSLMMNRLNKWLHATKINCFEVFKTVLCFKIINGNSIFTALFQLRFWQPVLILHVAISQLHYTIISTALHYFQIRWTYLEIWRQFTPSQLFFLCYTSEGEKKQYR